VSTLIFSVVFLTGMYWSPLAFVVPLVALVTVVVGTLEYCQIARDAGHRPVPWVSVLIAVALTLHGMALQLSQGAAVVVAALMLCGAALTLRNRVEKATGDMAVTLFGGLYTGLPIGLLLALYYGIRLQDRLGGAFVLLFVVALTWLCDSGAYLVGSVYGRIKLCEKLSPKKTVEGFIGGVVATIVFAFALKIAPMPGRQVLTWDDTMALALMICVLSPLGDLAESILKRDAGVKNSGVDLTGHGGILDVIDSVLFTGAAAYLYFLATRPWLFS